MQSHVYLPGEVHHATGLSIRRYAALGLILLCVALIGYSGVDLAKDIWLVNEAFPSLPSGFATDLDAALLFSPVMLNLDSMENGFLHFIKYPILTLPNRPLPTGNPIGDKINQAQKEQDLLRPSGALPLDNIMNVKESSMEAFGRAVYLSQDGSDAAQAFAQGEGHSVVYPGFAQEPAVKQLRQIFEIAYGQKALDQVTHEK
jgi:hypothetical protein